MILNVPDLDQAAILTSLANKEPKFFRGEEFKKLLNSLRDDLKLIASMMMGIKLGNLDRLKVIDMKALDAAREILRGAVSFVKSDVFNFKERR